MFENNTLGFPSSHFRIPPHTLSQTEQPPITNAWFLQIELHSWGEPFIQTANWHSKCGILTASIEQWKMQLGVNAGPVVPLPINQVTPDLSVDSPALGLDEEAFELRQLKQVQDKAES